MNLSSITTAAPVLVPVRAATTLAGTLNTSFENGDSVDGVTLATGDRILVKNQSPSSENGIYTVKSSGAPAPARDLIPAWRPEPGALVFVREGTVNARKGFMVTDDDPWTVAEHLHSTTGLVRALQSSYTDESNSGTSETDVLQYALAANTIRSTSEFLEFDYSGSTLVGGGGTRRLKVVFAGSPILDTNTVTPAAATTWRVFGQIICSAYGLGSSCSVRAAVSLSWAYPSTGAALAIGTSHTSVSSINFESASNTLKMTLTSSGSSGDLTAKTGVVRCATGY